MKHKTLLLLTDHRLTAWQWTPTACGAPQSFSTSQLTEFDSYLEQHRHPIWILVDLTEEEFHYEGLPHINDLDHYAAALQRLASHFPDTNLRMVVKQFKQTQVGKDDEMLYSALTNPARLTPWLEIIEARRIPLAGIYSAAHLIALLMKGSELERQLLVTQEAGAGLRTSYFYKGRLRFSRLAPAGNLAERSEAEARQTRPYLTNRRLLPRDQPLQVTVLCQNEDEQALQAHMPSDDGLPLQPLDLAEVAQRAGYAAQLNDSDATPLLLHLLATQAPLRQYAPENLTLRFRQRNTRRALYALAALIASAGVAWGGLNLWHAAQQHAQTTTLQLQAQQLQAQAAQIEQASGTLPAAAVDIKSTIALLQTLDQPPPQTLLTGLSQVLLDFPALQLLKLEWQMPTSTVLLQVSGENGVSEGIIQFRQALVDHGYGVTELQSGDGDSPAVLQLVWKVQG